MHSASFVQASPFSSAHLSLTHFPGGAIRVACAPGPVRLDVANAVDAKAARALAVFDAPQAILESHANAAATHGAVAIRGSRCTRFRSVLYTSGKSRNSGSGDRIHAGRRAVRVREAVGLGLAVGPTPDCTPGGARTRPPPPMGTACWRTFARPPFVVRISLVSRRELHWGPRRAGATKEDESRGSAGSRRRCAIEERLRSPALNATRRVVNGEMPPAIAADGKSSIRRCRVKVT